MTINQQAKVLMIAYSFPPSGGGGVQRPAKFAKYLPLHGWQPVVLTTTSGINRLKDEQLFNEIKHVKIVHIPSLFKINKTSNLILKFTNFMFRIVQNLIVSNWDWIIPGVLAAQKIIKEEKIDLIWATGNPFGSFFIAWILKIHTKIPIVIDYRDSWSFSEYDWSSSPIQKYFSRLWEKRILKSADHIVVVKPKMIPELQTLCPSVKNKISLITNGYDEEDFSFVITPIHDPIHYTITYTGVMWEQAGHHSPISLFKAIKILRNDPAIKKKIILQIIGDVDLKYKQLPATLGINDNVIFTGYLPHHEVNQYQIKSDALVLLIENKLGYTQSKKYSGIIPGKIFEYFASGVPILAIVPTPGFESETILITQTGLIATPNDPDDIAKKLKDLLLKKFSYKPDVELIEKYTRKNLTQNLSAIFNRIIQG